MSIPKDEELFLCNNEKNMKMVMLEIEKKYLAEESILINGNVLWRKTSAGPHHSISQGLTMRESGTLVKALHVSIHLASLAAL